jgi:hypothetical protein
MRFDQVLPVGGARHAVSTITAGSLQPSGRIRRNWRKSRAPPVAGAALVLPAAVSGCYLTVRAAGLPILSARWVSVDSTTSMENPLIALKSISATVWPTVITSMVAFAPE